MYYHVWIEFSEKNKTKNQNEYLYDLNNSDKIKKDIILPYKTNDPIIINGRFLQKNEVLRIKIVESKLQSKIIYDNFCREYSCICDKASAIFNDFQTTDITTDILDSINIKLNTKIQEEIEFHLHKKISDVSLQKYNDGYYADAVESAIKEINSRLKKMYRKFKNEELDGSDLFAKVFLDDENKTLLKVSDLSTQSGKDEQKGYRFMFMGMWFAMRNPKAHENLYMTQDEAYDRLIFISMLMKKIDKAFQLTFEE